jgi:hypothetical protein
MDEILKQLLERAMQKDTTWPDMQQEVGAYDALGPEGFRRHSNMGTLDERGALAQRQNQGELGMLQGQLEQAQQLSQPVGKNYGTVAGNIAGGVGDIIKQLGGGIRTHQLQGQQADMMKAGMGAQAGILDQKDQGRFDSGAAEMEAKRKLIEAMLAREQQPRAPSMGQQAGGFGLPDLQFNPYGG